MGLVGKPVFYAFDSCKAHMNSIDELKFLNRARDIFHNYELAPELHGLNKEDYLVLERGAEYLIIESLMSELLGRQVDLKFPNFPSKDGEI